MLRLNKQRKQQKASYQDRKLAKLQTIFMSNKGYLSMWHKYTAVTTNPFNDE
jgi:hypothetical protein